MKKQIIKGFILILFLSSVAYLAYRIIEKKDFKEQITEQTQQLPPFTFYTVGDSIPYTNRDIEREKVILVHFNTECNFCKEEVSEFKGRIKELSDLQLLLISEESQAVLQAFVKNNGLDQKPFTVLQSVDSQFYKTFGNAATPYALIYQNGELKATYKGLATVDAYLKHYESKL